MICSFTNASSLIHLKKKHPGRSSKNTFHKELKNKQVASVFSFIHMYFFTTSATGWNVVFVVLKRAETLKSC